MPSRTLYAQHPVSLRIFPSLLGSRLRFLSRCKFSTPTSTSLYSGINRLYAQNPVFEIFHDESVKAYLHMYDGNVQQNPLCVEPCVTEEFSISPRFSRMIFDPHANSVLLRAHLCTAAVSRLYAQETLRSKIVHDESVGLSTHTCTRGMLSRTLYT